MAFLRRANKPIPPVAVRSTLRASASRMRLDDKRVVEAQAVRRLEWQDEAWNYFDDIPEIKYSVWFEGNVMAKVKLFVAARDPLNPELDPVPINDDTVTGIPPALVASAQAELARLKGPLGGLSEIVRELNMNLEIAAECYLVGFGERMNPDGSITPEEWDIKSVSEVEQTGGTYKIKRSPNDQKPREVDPVSDTVIRIWQRHPRFSLMPDNNMRGALSDCEGAVIASNAIKAEGKSRMPAGFLLVSNDLAPGSPSAEDNEGEDGEEATQDPLLEVIEQAMIEAIEDPASASSVAPVIIRGPNEGLKEFRHVSVARTISGELPARLTMHVERIARGVNLPVETVMGHQQTTFANAEQVDQDLYEKHFQPRCVLVSDAFTVGFLQPNLLETFPTMGEWIDRIVIWFDPVDMLKQVDAAATADKGIELDLVSGEAWRRVNGWSEDDAPDPIERLIRLVTHLRAFDPGISTAILELLGVKLNIPDSLPAANTGPAASSPAVAIQRRIVDLALERKRAGLAVDVPEILNELATIEANVVAPALAAAASLPAPAAARRNVGYRLMLIDRELRARLLAAANSELTRALERAGNRLRSKAGIHRDLARTVDAWHVAATLGSTVIRASGLTDDDLIPPDAWSTLEEQFRTWGGQAQTDALSAVNDVIGLSTAQRDTLELRQLSDLDTAWTWLHDQLHDLAVARLYEPDPHAPALGEFDPTSKVPTGMIRQALSRAGGASGLTVKDGSPYVAVNNGSPLGGIGTGELVMGAAGDAGALVEAYEWVYGPAYRVHAFEDHEALDGEVFANFDDDKLVAGDWIGDYYYPGDHDGCACDIAPVIAAPEDLA